jgi:CheY-like chemotaxis protein
MPLEGVLIFFAEDGPDNQRLISHHLKQAGATVRMFDEGRLALEAMCERADAEALLTPPPCDLVVTDMQMPVMDGYIFTQRLRQRVGTGASWLSRRTRSAATANTASPPGATCGHPSRLTSRR